MFVGGHAGGQTFVTGPVVGRVTVSCRPDCCDRIFDTNGVML